MGIRRLGVVGGRIVLRNGVVEDFFLILRLACYLSLQLNWARSGSQGRSSDCVAPSYMGAFVLL